ncbi:MAG: LysR family transcriptional regulator [Bermanella sp.]
MKTSLDEMATFAEVVECGSFSKASQKMAVPVATVSRRVASLEKRLAVQLLRRTTRQQHLTDIGSVYFEHCQRMLQEAKAAELAVQNLQVEPTGVLRVTSPLPLDDPFTSKIILSFLQLHPKISLEFIINTRKVDLLEEKFDCAIIPGNLDDSSLITRGLGSTRTIYCVSPSYIKKFGLPTEVDQLQNHHMVILEPPAWLNLGIDPLIEKLRSRMRTNDFFVARRACVDGLGITFLPEVQILSDLAKGDLVEVLPQYAGCAPLSLVFPGDKQFTTKLRAFIDHMISLSSIDAPWKFS